jgi:hypothetical protein
MDPIDTSLVVRIKIGHQPRYLLALLWFGMMAILFLVVSPQSDLVGIFLVAAFVAGVVALALFILPQFNYLELNRNGFTMRHGRISTHYRWRDVSRIGVVTQGERAFIALDLADTVMIKARAKNQTTWGHDLVLQDHFELATQEVANMMMAYRNQVKK